MQASHLDQNTYIYLPPPSPRHPSTPATHCWLQPRPDTHRHTKLFQIKNIWLSCTNSRPAVEDTKNHHLAPSIVWLLSFNELRALEIWHLDIDPSLIIFITVWDTAAPVHKMTTKVAEWEGGGITSPPPLPARQLLMGHRPAFLLSIRLQDCNVLIKFCLECPTNNMSKWCRENIPGTHRDTATRIKWRQSAELSLNREKLNQI